MNTMHNTICFGKDTVEVINIEVDQVTELLVIPCPAWADRHVMADLIKAIAVERGLY